MSTPNCSVLASTALQILTSRQATRERKQSDSDSHGDADIEERADAKAEQKRNHAMCQIARILAKQATQRLRQRYKRAPQYQMTLSGVDPFTGSARPATNYLCLQPPPHAPVAIAAPLPDENDDGNDSGSESDDGEPEADGTAESDDGLPDNSDEASGNAGVDSKDPAASDAVDSKDEKDSASASKSKAQRVPELPIEVAVFAENAFVNEYLNAGRSRGGRARRLSAPAAASLYGPHNVT
jgi:hypothetical protein